MRHAGFGLVLAALLGLSPLFAQSDNASVSGFIRDASLASVPGATVIVRNEATGVERKTATNEDGYYVASNLPPGTYAVRVEAAGFNAWEQSGLKLDPNAVGRTDAVLQLGALTETVQVSASTAQVQSESATVGKVVDRQQIDALELNGRNPIFLAQLVPGVRRSDPLANYSSGLSSGGFNINGSRPQDNLITFDGAVAIRTRSNGTSIGVADVDSTQEVQVLTANYNAEYGRAAGGQIRIVTKSGTQHFHGDFYNYFRNSALNANSWERNTSPTTNYVTPFRYNQFGYNLNGPVYVPGLGFNRDRNRVFWLFGQEWLRLRRDATNIQTVPTLAMRQGDFSELLNRDNPFYGRSVMVRDPATGLPFPNNVIPAARLSPNGIGLLRAYDAPTPGFQLGADNLIHTAAAPVNQRKDTLAIDVNPTDRHFLRLRHQNYAFEDYTPFDGDSSRVPKIFKRPNKTVSLNYVYTVGTSMVNEFLGTASLDGVYIFIDTASGAWDRTRYGIDYPYIFPEGKEIPNRIPTVFIPNFLQLNGGPYPSHSSGPIYNFADTFTVTQGSHTIKAGLVYEKSGQNDFDQINVAGVPGGTNNQNGRFQFSDRRTGAPTSGVGIANAALGLFDVYSEIGPRSYTPYRGNMYEYFVQDSWKVGRKLRLELGLRHSFIRPYHSLWGNMSVFNPASYDPARAVVQDPETGYILSGDRYNGMVIPGDRFPAAARGRIPFAETGEFDRLFRGLPKSYSKTHKRDLQPRLGVAWSWDEKTVIRSGVGRFFTRLGVSDSVFLGGNPPFQPIVSVSNGSVDNPGGGAANVFPLTVTSQDPVFRNPQAWAWNVTVERQIGGETIASVAYIGRRGLHGQRERNINQLAPGTLLANPGVNPDYLRPYKGYGAIRVTNNDANSLYNGLQLNATRRFARGLSFGAAYTYSKTMDDGSSQRDVIPDAYDRSAMWGPSSYDTRHVLVVNWIYELPVLRGRSSAAGRLLGGWQISGIMQAQTGTPFTIGGANDTAGVGELGYFDNNPSNNHIQVWNIEGDPRLTKKFAGDGQWFQTANPDGSDIFTAPPAGTFTAQRNRNRVYGPGFQNWNLGLFKAFALGERQRIQFRAEAFNFVNHPNWSNPDINPDSGSFGKVRSKRSERNLQLSLRYQF